MEDLFYCGEEVIATGRDGKGPFVPPKRYRTQTFRRFKTHDEMPPGDDEIIYDVPSGWNHSMDPLLGKKISDTVSFTEYQFLYIKDDVVYSGKMPTDSISVGWWTLSEEMTIIDTEKVLIEDED